MKLQFTTALVAAFAAIQGAVAAPLARRSDLSFTNGDYEGITVGTPLAITWAGNSGAVTVNLKSGDANDLQTIGTIASGVWGTSASWAPATEGTYAFEIIDSAGAVNYSPKFYVSSASALARRSMLYLTHRPSLASPYQPGLRKEVKEKTDTAAAATTTTADN